MHDIRRVVLAIGFAGLAATLSTACSGAKDASQALADGMSCTADADCRSAHCNAGLCCASGSCCSTPADCPSSFASASACTDPGPTTTCQGTRREAVCEAYVCGSTTVADDSGCAGAVRSCGAYAPVACTAAADQPAAACATTCTGPADCNAGHACTGGACTLVPTLGQACTGTGQGSCASGLKCENGVCCDAASAVCCSSAAQCANGLACDATTASCFTGCTDGDASRCASPTTTYCAANACVARLGTGAACSTDAECASDVCECFDAACATRKCRTSACGTCEYAASDTSCVGGLGAPTPVPDPTPGECSGTNTCAAGACRKADGQPCATNAECANVCIGTTCAPRAGPGGACDEILDCLAGLTCAGGRCLAPNGTSCTDASQCGSGYCTDGYCCNSACDGAVCEACNLPGLKGTCSAPADDAACGSISCDALNSGCAVYGPITTNRCASVGVCKTATLGTCPPPSYQDSLCPACQKCSSGACVDEALGEDLKNECAAATCTTGTCDGHGACGFVAAGISCADSNACTYGDHCDGAGNCVGTSYTCAGLGYDANCSPACDGTGTCTCDTNYTYPAGQCTTGGFPGTLECDCGTCKRHCVCQPAL